MAKVSVKFQQDLDDVLNAISAHKKEHGSLPEVLECNVGTFSHLHTAVMGTVEDDKLKKFIHDRGLKVKVGNLKRIRVIATLETSSAF